MGDEVGHVADYTGVGAVVHVAEHSFFNSEWHSISSSEIDGNKRIHGENKSQNCFHQDGSLEEHASKKCPFLVDEEQNTEVVGMVGCVSIYEDTLYGHDLHSSSNIDGEGNMSIPREHTCQTNLHQNALVEGDAIKINPLLNNDNNGNLVSQSSLSAAKVLEPEGRCSLNSSLMHEVNASLLFQLMSIVYDKQELCFVEKIHVLEDQILKLCNHLPPISAECRYLDARINFQDLNTISMPVVGCYGNKGMLAKMMKRMNFINDVVYLKLFNDDIKAGLYAVPLTHCLLLFYWHRGTEMEEGTRNNISCNFIRYLADLSDRVFIFEEDDVFDAFSVSIRQEKWNSTKRLKIS